MIEVEIKAPAGRAELTRKLNQLGAVFEKKVWQIDSYYNAPHRDFKDTDEALRLREQGSRIYMTYKGKKLDPLSKTRKEVEVEVGDRDKMEDILISLGFRKTLDVIKERQIYHYKNAEICLDRVEGLGEFVEVEAMAENQKEIVAKRDEVTAILRELGVTADLIRESYLEMLLQKQC
ncbi:class IV adenylate cyclase [Methanocella sp. MCL-LM]|uniref:class IV adenylate cyclase n=1 Tax=Methanocella sp. MCL-LM TaxID=3412035 RepID=UPI003C71AD23